MKLIYSKDDDNKDGLFSEDGKHQVMMEWEKEYMEECINKLNPSGDILEIGFGMAYSANKIQSFDSVTSHTIIECNPTVLEKLEDYQKTHQNVKIIRGRWQDMLQTCGLFDFIFFDDYIIDDSNTNNIRFNNFLLEVLLNHTKINSKISLYSQTPDKYTYIDCIKFELFEYNAIIPNNCKYVNSNKLYIPIITKINEPNSDLKDIIMQINNNSVKKSDNLEPLTKKVNESITHFQKPICNLIVIDNVYVNPYETRDNILKQDFSIKGNYPGQRTLTYASNELKNLIQSYVEPCGGKIKNFNLDKTNDNYNGCFQFTTSRDRSWIHVDNNNTWAGVLYMTPDAPLSSGTGFYQFIDGTRTRPSDEEKYKYYNNYSQDLTKWQLVDKIGNKFNRLILFRSKQYHMSLDYFGTDKHDSRLFQVFFFDTER